jgi:hypothetical protein
MPSWIVLIIAAILAVAHSPWWSALVVVTALYKANKWWYYRSRPWRRVHFPMMRAYAAVIGAAVGEEERTGKPVDMHEVLTALVSASDPTIQPDEATQIIGREYERCANFYDIDLIESYMLGKNPAADKTLLRTTLEKYRPYFNVDDKGTITRMVIAAVIERQFTKEDRGEYMYEVINNRAN